MKDKYENQMLENWHSYKELDGKLTFEEFFGHDINVQSMLIRMRKWQRAQGIRDTIRGSE
jgi:hypothetical protein|tara:strand:- start:311 stop:490 length:180 start_codon:yes stop_codon:yes gene_type:complete